MIKINLLPPDLAAAQSKKERRALPWRKIGIAAAVVVAGISIGLPAEHMRRSRAVERLRAEWKRLEPEQQRLSEVQGSVQLLQRQGDALQAAKNVQAQWAPRLQLLSEAVIPQVWLTHLEFAQGKNLRVEGTALVGSGGGDKSGQVAKFLQQLKEQPGFQDWFSGVNLESVEHRNIGQEEVADFVLLLTPTG